MFLVPVDLTILQYSIFVQIPDHTKYFVHAIIQ